MTFAGSLKAAITVAGPTPDQLKNDTSPIHVLEAAAKRFGLDREQYDITSGRDGTPRIRHADKHYNLGDFFTKHLEVPWSEAKEILKTCYYQTLSEGLPPPDKALWKSFGTWREDQFKVLQGERSSDRKTTGETILEARTRYKERKVALRAVPKASREPLMALARAEKIVTVAAAQQRARADKEKNKSPPRNAMYRSFLTELAGRGNLGALGELRRLTKPEADMDRTVTGQRSTTVLPHPDYRVDHTGKVTYYQATKPRVPAVMDSAKGVAVVDDSPPAYALALKVAVARYGSQLTLNGSPEFVKTMTAAARKTGMNITIRDAAKPQERPTVIRGGPELDR